jgi:uncharacterized protein (TIGR02217 family)
MTFIETRLLETLSYGFAGGPTWNTGKVTLRSGVTRRNVKRSRPLHRFSGSFNLRDPDVVAILLQAFNATRGAAYGFRFKNWLDYQLVNEPLGLGTAAAEEYQLIKTYTFGTQSVAVPLRKPNNDLVVKANNAVVSSSVDTTTGIVTLSAPAGHALTVSGTFDLPVMFTNDEFGAIFQAYEATTIEIQLEEDIIA